MHNVKQITMQAEKTDVIALIFKIFLKVLPPFIVGLTAKIANDINEGRKLSFVGWTVIACLTLSGTFISNWICEYYSLNKNATLIINAFSTMFSEQIFKLLYHNFFRFAGSWVKENLKISLMMAKNLKGMDNQYGDKVEKNDENETDEDYNDKKK